MTVRDSRSGWTGGRSAGLSAVKDWSWRTGDYVLSTELAME